MGPFYSIVSLSLEALDGLPSEIEKDWVLEQTPASQHRAILLACRTTTYAVQSKSERCLRFNAGFAVSKTFFKKLKKILDK
jgi:hypothetical protein